MFRNIGNKFKAQMIKSYIFTQIKKFISQKVLERTKIDVVCDNAFVTLSVRVHQSDLEEIFKSSIPDEVSKAHELLDKLNIPRKIYSEEGSFCDEKGTYYLKPLVDRIDDLAKSHLAVKILTLLNR